MEAYKKNILSWAAIGIAILSLIVSLITLNETKPKIELAEQVQSEISNLRSKLELMQQQTEFEQARQRLEDLGKKLAENSNYEEALREIENIRQDLRNNFQNAQKEARQFWQEADQQLGIIEEQLKEKSNKALDTLNKLIESLKNFKLINQNSL